MRNLQNYFKTVVEVNKNSELIEYIESNLLQLVEYQVKLENYLKQPSLDSVFINDKTFFDKVKFRGVLRDISTNPYNIINELKDEDVKIGVFFNSDKVYSVDGSTISIIGEYRKLTSFATKIFESIEPLYNQNKSDNDDLKAVLNILNHTIDIFRRAFIEYSSITNQIDISVKNFNEFSKKCIDMGSNAK